MFNYKITIGGVEFKEILLETLALEKYDYAIRYFFVSYDGVPTRPVRLLFNKGFKTKEAAEEYFKKLVEELNGK